MDFFFLSGFRAWGLGFWELRVFGLQGLGL